MFRVEKRGMSMGKKTYLKYKEKPFVKLSVFPRISLAFFLIHIEAGLRK